MRQKLINTLLFSLIISPLYSQEESNIITHKATNLAFCAECAEQARKLIKYPVPAIENNIAGTINALLIIYENRKVSEVKL